jgi:nucleoside-diphosphate-sugar epimerase
MSRVIVFGAGGYLGIPLVEELISRKHDVWAVDRWFFGKKPDGVVNTIHSDIRTCDPRLMPEMDAVIDLAGLSNDASADIDTALTTAINFGGAMQFARRAKEAGTKKYIYSSSCSVYGSGEHPGLVETNDCKPLTAYARSKVGVEEGLRSIASPDFDPIILRNATVFGVAPRMRFDLAVNIMTLRAWRDNLIYCMGGGQQMRPFIHVMDVVRAFVLALERKEYTNDTFNVGGDDMNMSIDGLAKTVKSVFPTAAIHHIPDDIDRRSYHVSFAKIKEAFQFKPHHSILNGICEVRKALIDGTISGDDETAYTVSWYKKLIEWDKRLADIRLDGRIL